MLQLHVSNRFEALADMMAARLGPGRGDPFDADTVIVPSAGVRRALEFHLARAHGVCAGVEFGFLAQWLWQQMRRALPALPAASPLEPAVLAWRVYAALGDAGFVAAHPPLMRYLRDADAVMRLELAERVAALLEQVPVHRPAWPAAWMVGRLPFASEGTGAVDPAAAADERWLAALWRRLVGDAPGALDAVHPAAAFVAALDAAPAAAADLPPAVHVFAPPALAPLHTELLVQLARHLDVHLFLLNPCRAWWSEVVPPQRLAWLAARGRAQGHEVGNRLLAAWGRQTQALIDKVYDRAGDTLVEHDAFVPHPGDTLLARWQNAVLDLDDLAPGTVALADDDRSVEVHVCHSLIRELEALHDRLLARFADDPTLQPGEVLVVTPDLEAAAPLIEAVFGSAPPERMLPYALTGRARSRVNLPARALLALLDLAASRCAAGELFAVLRLPVVARRFGLDETALEDLHDALLAGGLRWGLDAEHRAAAGAPAAGRHTLADALDRLFLGHAMPAVTDEATPEPVAGVLPAGDLEGSEALVLGALHRFAQALQRLHERVAQPQPAADWAQTLQAVLDDFVAPAADELADLAELQAGLRRLADGLARADVAEPLPLPVLRRALAQVLDDPARGGVPGGAITFSALSPLRGLPYDVVCIVGLNGDAFPASSRPPEFDLLAARPQRGDRQRRQDDRNLLLDLLLAARRAVHLSFTGRSVRDNSALPPSVLVDEWLDVLVPAIATDPSDPASLRQARARLVAEHPLQPFAAEHFAPDGDPRLHSFRRELCDALAHSLQREAAALAESADDAFADSLDDGDSDFGDDTDGDAPRADDTDGGASWAPPPRFFDAALPPPAPEWRTTTLERLIAFFRHPARELLRRRLGLTLARDEAELRDDEPFVPDREAGWRLGDRLLPALMAGADGAQLRRLAAADPEWPAGALGDAPLAALLAKLTPFAARVQAATAAPALPPHAGTLAFELDGEAWQITGAHADLRPGGLLRWRAAKLGAGDLLQAWLHHLWLGAFPPPGGAQPTRWLALDDTLELRPMPPAAAHEQLAMLLRLYRRGLTEPLPFFPKAAWAYVAGDGDWRGARTAFEPSDRRPYAEGADPALRLAWRGRGDPLGGDFAALAISVFGPLRDHIAVADEAA